MPTRYILTGAPGSGKTTILRALQGRGYPTVDEVATDLIAEWQARGIDEPWSVEGFIDSVLNVQEARMQQPCVSPVQFFDRGPVDTLALCRFLDMPVDDALMSRIVDMDRAGRFQREVFFVDSLGFVVNTQVRRITLEQAEHFGVVFHQTYEELGYTCIHVPCGAVEDRADLVLRTTRMRDHSA